MSGLANFKAPCYVHRKDEMEYRRLRYELDTKFKNFASALLSNESEKQVESPFMETRKDPLKSLDDDSMECVLKLLTGLDLLKAMQVSPGWKKFIEGQDLLMRRAMDEVRFRPNMFEISHELQEKIFNVDRQKREYKHMSTLFMMAPLACFALSLQTLELTHPERWWNVSDDWTGLNFPKLKMIRFVGHKSAFLVLQNFSLPVLTHLQLICEVPNEESCCKAEDLSIWLRNFQSLKCLFVKCSFVHDDGSKIGTLCPWSMNDIESVDFPINEHLQQHEMQEMSVDKFYLNVLIHHAKFLQFLEIFELEPLQFRWILQHMKNLKTLKTCYVNLRGGIFPSNASIEVISFERFCDEDSELEGLLRALPSLKKILGWTIDANMLRFIASNMRHLELLAVHPLTDEIREVHDEIRDNRQLNSNFIIIDSPMATNLIESPILFQSPIEAQFKEAFKYEKLSGNLW